MAPHGQGPAGDPARSVPVSFELLATSSGGPGVLNVIDCITDRLEKLQIPHRESRSRRITKCSSVTARRLTGRRPTNSGIRPRLSLIHFVSLGRRAKTHTWASGRLVLSPPTQPLTSAIQRHHRRRFAQGSSRERNDFRGSLATRFVQRSLKASRLQENPTAARWD